jgi:hypothetical protein
MVEHGMWGWGKGAFVTVITKLRPLEKPLRRMCRGWLSMKSFCGARADGVNQLFAKFGKYNWNSNMGWVYLQCDD